MTRGKQKIEAQKRNAEKNQKPKGSQLEARAAAFKTSCPICKVRLDRSQTIANRFDESLNLFRLLVLLLEI
ncbi:hypothetical protein Sjap_004034 [Stephania japonica]|uniref:Small EDRK-rich factor-like N-terminal domain-containing protein n=1 Tax=Stephania japonica TaxID=461633 RepID=A0AAP0PKI2_9MAGN